MKKEDIESIDVKQLAEDVIKYGILDTEEQKEMTEFIIHKSQPYNSIMHAPYENKYLYKFKSKYHK